jgi:hypothetical protein
VECELIVVDNGSTDEGPQIARQFGAQVLVMPGLLIGALRNRGVEARHRRMAGLHRCRHRDARRLAAPSAEAGGRRQVADVFGLDLHTPAQAPWYATAWQRRTLRPSSHTYRCVDWLPSANLLMRRRWFDKVDGFNETLRTGEDKDFTLRHERQGCADACRSTKHRPALGLRNELARVDGQGMWRQGSHLQLLRTHGMSLRLLRFPMLSLLCLAAGFSGDFRAAHGFPHHAMIMVLPRPCRRWCSACVRVSSTGICLTAATVGPALGAPAPGRRRVHSQSVSLECQEARPWLNSFSGCACCCRSTPTLGTRCC